MPYLSSWIDVTPEKVLYMRSYVEGAVADMRVARTALVKVTVPTAGIVPFEYRLEYLVDLVKSAGTAKGP